MVFQCWAYLSDLHFTDSNTIMIVLKHNSDPQLAIGDTCSLLFWPIAAACILYHIGKIYLADTTHTQTHSTGALVTQSVLLCMRA